MPDELFRIYLGAGQDGYPPEWHETIKHLVRAEAGNRCVRCQHPYEVGTPLNEGWSPCDEHCTHGDVVRITPLDPADQGYGDANVFDLSMMPSATMHHARRGFRGFEANEAFAVEARWRILTVHHLNGMKLDCRWWNLAALCQRCHLTIQGKVRLERAFIRAHSDWFKPYAAGWYAHKYLNEDLTRAETLARLDDLLSFELTEEALF